ncbi:MAG: outer membrane protein assembly factor BamB family protein [Planctomycetaceae bacterium]
MSRVRVLFACVLGLLACAADLPAVNGQTVMPPEPVLNRLGLTRGWWGHATIDRSRDKVKHITADETLLVMQSTSGGVTAFDAETGRHLWSRQLGPTDRVGLRPTISDELLLAINGLNLYGVDKRTGEILWEFNLPRQPTAQPVIDDQQMYIGCLDGSLYSIDLATIADLHQKGMLPQFEKEAITWRYRTSDAIVIPAVPLGSRLVFASTSGTLYSVATDNRRLIYQFEADAALSAPMVRYKNRLLLASEDTNFYSIEINNGHRNWEYTSGLVTRKAPVLIQDEVYLLPEHGSLTKLSAATGRPLWPRSVPKVEAVLAVSSEKLYGADRQNNLMVLARDSGRMLGRLPLGAFTKHISNDRSDRIFVATESGLVMCLHELGRDFPRYHLHPERLPVLPEFAAEGSGATAAESDSPPDAAAESDDDGGN